MNRAVKSKRPVARWKIAAIPVLVVILIYVMQPASESQGTSETIETTAVSAAPKRPAGAGVAAILTAPWPTYSLSEVLAHNPFTWPGEPEIIQPELEVELREQPATAAPVVEIPSNLAVSAIYQDPQGAAAIVNGTILREGDLVADRVRIADIQPFGIVLEVVP